MMRGLTSTTSPRCVRMLRHRCRQTSMARTVSHCRRNPVTYLLNLVFDVCTDAPYLSVPHGSPLEGLGGSGISAAGGPLRRVNAPARQWRASLPHAIRPFE